MLSFSQKRFCFFLAIIASFGWLHPASGFAQVVGTIVGKVTDVKTGEPLPGANVLIKNTRQGSASAPDGSYKITNVPAGTQTITTTFIGYHAQEVRVNVPANAPVTADFALKESALEMDEIVVTGTGYELKKRELTTSISTINRRDIESTPALSVDQLLQGRLNGGSVNVNSGMPGTGSRIRLRGVNSAYSNQTPVIYLDGVKVDNNDFFRLEQLSGGVVQSTLSDILISDVERVEVTKGGAAATLYGSEAAAGVIQIFTKKGKAGPPRFTLKVEQGVNDPETKFVIENFTKDAVLQSGYHQRYSAGVEGGSETLTYHLSGYVLDSDGTLPKDGNTQYSFRGGFRAIPNEKWQLDFSGGLVRDNFERMFNGNALADLIGAIESHSEQFFGEGVTDADRRKLVQDYSLPDLNYAVNRFTFGTTAAFDPAKYFSTRLTLGMDYRKNEERQFIPIAAGAVTSIPGGGLGRSDREFLTLTLDYAGTIKYPQAGNITSAFTFGAQGFRQEDRESSVTATEFGLPGTDDFDNAANLAPLESNRQIFSGGFFFNEQVGIWNKLFVNAGVRIDGNTAFGDAVNLASYPKFGAAYNISDEAFWRQLPWSGVWHQLKLRGSWGQTGSFPAPFTKDKTFVQGAYLDGVAANFGNPGDEDLGPEKTRTVELGFDAALLSERVGLEFNAFRSRTVDALFTVPSATATGLGFQLRNVGTIKNSGIELGLNASILNTRNVRFSLRGSYSTLTNKVASLGGAQAFSLGGFGFLPQRVEASKPVGIFQSTRPNDDPATPQREFDTVLDRSPLAEKYFSLGANLTLWRNLQLSILGDGQTGGYVLNTGAVLRYFNGGEPEASRVPPGYSFSTASDVFLEKADFFKIREITASYRLPQNYFGTHLRLIASIRNVATFAKAKNMDPELHGLRDGSVTNADVGGINFFTLPPPHQFRFALEAEL